MKRTKQQKRAVAGSTNGQDIPMEDQTLTAELEDVEMPNGDFDLDANDESDAIEQLDDDENVDVEDSDSFDAFSDADSEDNAGVPIPAGRPLSPSSVPMLNQEDRTGSTVLSASASELGTASLDPEKPSPYIFDAGHMLITDPNPLMHTTNSISEQVLASTARDAAQSLFNHMLLTCPIHRAPAASTSSSGITMTLPQPSMQLPREKKIPQAKPPTKWEQFAAKKGIGKHNRRSANGKNGELLGTEAKTVYDEATGEWVPKWGYKGRNKRGEGEWLVEVDEKKEKQQGSAHDARKEDRTSRKDRMRRNERAQRANERRTRKPT